LDTGCDDHVVKPIDLTLARLKATSGIVCLVRTILLVLLVACSSTPAKPAPIAAPPPDAASDAAIDVPLAAPPPDAAPPDAAIPIDAAPVAPKPVAKPKPDVLAYAKPGEAPDLVPVKGKLTIFDFGATWCQPCKTLDPALLALATKYPHVVAIRKLDVVDLDSKAAARYLVGFDLPHLKVFDARGKRILEKSSAPGKLQSLIDEVRSLVEAAAR
jgi:thiol-disulfide isomerase/thioredoxin